MYVLRQGEHLDKILVHVGGKLHIQRDAYWGNRSIINMVSVGEMFGEAYVAPESGTLMNDMLAVEDSVVVFFDVKRIITVCSSACRFHSIVLQNLFFAIREEQKACAKANLYDETHYKRKADSMSFGRSESTKLQNVLFYYLSYVSIPLR